MPQIRKLEKRLGFKWDKGMAKHIVEANHVPALQNLLGDEYGPMEIAAGSAYTHAAPVARMLPYPSSAHGTTTGRETELCAAVTNVHHHEEGSYINDATDNVGETITTARLARIEHSDMNSRRPLESGRSPVLSSSGSLDVDSCMRHNDLSVTTADEEIKRSAKRQKIHHPDAIRSKVVVLKLSSEKLRAFGPASARLNIRDTDRALGSAQRLSKPPTRNIEVRPVSASLSIYGVNHPNPSLPTIPSIIASQVPQSSILLRQNTSYSKETAIHNLIRDEPDFELTTSTTPMADLKASIQAANGLPKEDGGAFLTSISPVLSTETNATYPTSNHIHSTRPVPLMTPSEEPRSASIAQDTSRDRLDERLVASVIKDRDSHTPNTSTQPRKLLLQLITSNAKQKQFIAVSFQCSIEDLFEKVQKRMDERLKGKLIKCLLLLLPNQSSDDEPYRIQRDDPDTWEVFLEVAEGVTGRRIRIAADVEYEGLP